MLLFIYSYLLHLLLLFLLLLLQVFEDDCFLSQATDSGCPSETLLEEEGALDKPNLDLPAVSNHPKGKNQYLIHS